MPKLISLYIRQVAIGFAIAALFVATLLWFDVAGLRHLVTADKAGWLAVAMLWISNGIVFAGVQFGIRVMMMADRRETPRGGLRQRIDLSRPVPVRHAAEQPKRRHFR